MSIRRPQGARTALPALFAALLLVSFLVPAPGGAQTGDRYSAPDAAYQGKDYATAHRLWLQLAEEGNPSAYFNLGRMYVFGEGVKVDLLEAYKWFKLAEKVGLPQAKSGLTRVSPLMTQSDITEANHRIERWYDLHPRTRR